MHLKGVLIEENGINVYFEILKRMNFNWLDENTIFHGYIKHNGISYEIFKKIVTGFKKKKPTLNWNIQIQCVVKLKINQLNTYFLLNTKSSAMKCIASRDFYLIEIDMGHI